MDPKLKRFSALLLKLAVSGAFAAWECVELHSYGVPVLLMLSCGLALWATVLATWESVAKAVVTTTHRCTEPGCDFTVRLRHASAAENRRWQETAAAHPAHRP